MKNVSYWAKCNIHTARFLVVLLEVSLFLLAVRFGLLMLRSGIRLPVIAVAVPLFLFGISILMYYSETAWMPWRSSRYLRRRLSFFAMALCMFSLTVFFVGSEKLLTWNSCSSLSGRDASLLVKPAAFPANPLSGKSAKKLDRLLNKMRKHRSAAPLYVALIIVATVLISILLANLSCSLACNGNGALAVLVGVLGIGGVVFLCVWFCRKLLKDQLPANNSMQQRLEQQQHNREKRLERRKSKREQATPENAGTANA